MMALLAGAADLLWAIGWGIVLLRGQSLGLW